MQAKAPTKVSPAPVVSTGVMVGDEAWMKRPSDVAGGPRAFCSGGDHAGQAAGLGQQRSGRLIAGFRRAEPAGGIDRLMLVDDQEAGGLEHLAEHGHAHRGRHRGEIHTTRAPADLASRAARSDFSNGTSICKTRTVSARKMAGGRSEALAARLAPLATVIAFSPRA